MKISTNGSRAFLVYDLGSDERSLISEFDSMDWTMPLHEVNQREVALANKFYQPKPLAMATPLLLDRAGLNSD